MHLRLLLRRYPGMKGLICAQGWPLSNHYPAIKPSPCCILQHAWCTPPPSETPLRPPWEGADVGWCQANPYLIISLHQIPLHHHYLYPDNNITLVKIHPQSKNRTAFQSSPCALPGSPLRERERRGYERENWIVILSLAGGSASAVPSPRWWIAEDYHEQGEAKSHDRQQLICHS